MGWPRRARSVPTDGRQRLQGKRKVDCATVAHPRQVCMAPVLPVGFAMSRSSSHTVRTSNISAWVRAGMGTVVMAVVLALCVPLMSVPANAAAGPVGAGFTVTAGDLDYILKQ